MDHHGATRSYTPPAVVVLGSVHALTQTGPKTIGWSDGFLFLDDRVTHSS